MKTQTTDVAKEAALLNQSETKLDQKSIDLEKQVSKTIPLDIRKVEKEIEGLTALKARVSKDAQKGKDKIEQINV